MRIETICLVGILLLFSAASALARGPQNVTNTPHNLSNNPPSFYQAMNSSDNEDEICIFCHTPHGGSLTGPLWNRSDPGTTYTHYNSASLSSALKSSRTQNIFDESLLCLSCHDGSISMYTVINPNNRTGGQPVNAANPSGEIRIGVDGVSPGPRIGASPADLTASHDLTDDHPISFSYSAVKSYYDANGRGSELKTVATAENNGNGVRFFGATDRVECSSCHDPHVDYDAFGLGSGDPDYMPFLIMPNIGSAMCLACHSK